MIQEVDKALKKEVRCITWRESSDYVLYTASRSNKILHGQQFLNRLIMLHCIEETQCTLAAVTGIEHTPLSSEMHTKCLS